MTPASSDVRQPIRPIAEHEHDELTAAIGRIHELGEELATLPVAQQTTTLIADLSGLETLLRATVERDERLPRRPFGSEADRWEPEWRD